MKIVLILMVRNESKILQRCLTAVADMVDAFCIHDTGSTDNTVEIATEFVKTHKGCITQSVWKDFGHNRSLSFDAAQSFVKNVLEWDLKDTYGLLLDADMVFHPETLRDQTLGGVGYTVLQEAGTLLYPNARLLRMDHAWKCTGVTHEYWDGPTSSLGRDVCWIEDRNDGGCKSDKFERDARLLEKGLAEEPTNVRYMFYLAQTYHSLGRWKDAIEMYQKRYDAGGWDEERWYSLYMIGQSWLSLNEPTEFEKYMLLAYTFRPSRAENIYKLAKYFREKSQHYKSYQYVTIGQSIAPSKDSLFVETSVYSGLFDYEATILMYYLGHPRRGLRESMRYMLTKTDHLDSVYKNMAFYVEPIGKKFTNHPVMRDACGRDYHPSSVSRYGEYENVRFVNYSIDGGGGYDMKEGNYSPNHKVRTQNVLYVHGVATKMKDASIQLPRRDVRILGLEDVRIYSNHKSELRFVATSSEYSDNIRIVAGAYNLDGTYSDCKVIESPLGSSCEKNWIPVGNTSDIIYSWSPMRIGKLVDNTLEICTTHTTPWFFQHLRGSAVPCRVGSDLWCLVHYVEYSMPRKYFHCIVSLNPVDYKPKAISMPFVFREQGIEYCLGMTNNEKTLQFVFSSWDDNPCTTEVNHDDLEWIQV